VGSSVGVWYWVFWATAELACKVAIPGCKAKVDDISDDLLVGLLGDGYIRSVFDVVAEGPITW